MPYTPLNSGGYVPLNTQALSDWTRVGIFDRNNVTGQLRLAPMENALAGLSDGMLGRVENGEFMTNAQFINDEGNVLFDHEIDKQIFPEHSDESDGFFEQWWDSTIGKEQQFLANRFLGGAAVTEDLATGIQEGLGLHDLAREPLMAAMGPVGLLAVGINKLTGTSASELRQAAMLEAQGRIAKEPEQGLLKNIIESQEKAEAAKASAKSLLFNGTALMLDMGLTFGMGAGSAIVARVPVDKAVLASSNAMIFGADAFGSTYDSNRQGGSGRISALGLAGAAAVSMATIDKWGINNMMSGNGMMKSFITGAITGVGIHTSQSYLSNAAREDVDIWSTGFLTQTAMDSVDSAITLGSMGPGLHGLGKVMNAARKGFVNTVDIREMSKQDLQRFVSEYGVVRRALDSARTDSGALTPQQTKYVKTFLNRWSHVNQMSEILKNGLDHVVSPVKSGQREIMKELSDIQVFDEPIKDKGVDVDTDTTAKIVNPPIDTFDNAWQTIETVNTERSTNKAWQVEAQRKIDAAEWILDHQAVMDEVELGKVDNALKDFYQGGGSKRLSPAQRERLVGLYKRIQETSNTPYGKGLAEAVAEAMDADLNEVRNMDPRTIENQIAELKVDKLVGVEPASILNRVRLTIDKLVEDNGTLLPDRAVDILDKTLDHLIERSNEWADNLSDDAIQARRNLELAITKVASVLPTDKVDMQKLRPVAAAEFIREMNVREDNLWNEIRSKILLANAAVQAITKKNIGVYPFPDELKPDFETADAMGTEVDPQKALKAQKEMELYALNITKGIPGLSTYDILDMTTNRGVQEAVVSGMADIMTPSEIAELNSVLTNGRHITPDFEFDWQGIHERAIEWTKQKTMEFAKDAAAKLAAQGRGGTSAMALTAQDEGISKARRKVVTDTLKAAREANNRFMRHVKVQSDRLKALRAIRDDRKTTLEQKREVKAQIKNIMAEIQEPPKLVKEYRGFLSSVQKFQNEFLESGARTALDKEVFELVDDDGNILFEKETIYDRDEAASSIAAGVLEVWESTNIAMADKGIINPLHRMKQFIATLNATLGRSGLLRRYGGSFEPLEAPEAVLQRGEIVSLGNAEAIGLLYASMLKAGKDIEAVENILTMHGVPEDAQLRAEYLRHGTRNLIEQMPTQLLHRMPKGIATTPESLHHKMQSMESTKEAVSAVMDSHRSYQLLRRMIRWGTMTPENSGRVQRVVANMMNLRRPGAGWSVPALLTARKNWQAMLPGIQAKLVGGPVNLIEELGANPVRYKFREKEEISPDRKLKQAERMKKAGEGDMIPEKQEVSIGDRMPVDKSGIQRMAQERATPENVMNNGAFTEHERAAARQLVDYEYGRRQDLRDFYQMTKESGYRWFRLTERDELILMHDGPITPDQAQLLNYISRFYESAAESFNNINTPESFAFSLVESGHSLNTVVNVMSLVNALAKRYSQRTGRPQVDFYERSVNFVRSITPELAKLIKDVDKFDNVRGIETGLTNFEQLPGRGKMIALAPESVTTSRTHWNAFTSVHELLHGMIESGVLREMLSKEELKAIETWLGPLPEAINVVKANPHKLVEAGRVKEAKEALRSGPKVVGKQSGAYEEKLIRAVNQVLAMNQVEGPLNSALRSIRNSFFTFLQSNLGKGELAIVSGVSYMDFAVPKEIQDAILGMFGEFKSTTQFNITGDKVLWYVSSGVAEGVRQATGIDITPILHQRSVHWAEALRELAANKKIKPDEVYTTDMKDLQSLENWAKDLGLSGMFGEEARKRIATEHKIYLRKMELFDSTGLDPDAISISRPMAVEAELAQTMMEATTPLANGTQDQLIKMLDGIIGAEKLRLFDNTDGPITTKGLKNHAVEMLRVLTDKAGLKKGDRGNWARLFEAKQAPAEQLANDLGLTEEFMLAHNLGGLYAQAAAVLEHGVMVQKDGKWKLIHEPLSAILAEIPANISEDVWRYLAAMREIELDEANMTALREYSRAMVDWERNPQGEAPRKPQTKKIRFKNLGAAEIVKTYIEAKYGKDGGAVGEFAKRIVGFSNAAIVDRLHFYGFISDKERADVLRVGKWWIPMVKIDKIIEDSGAAPIYNDGTKEALSSLRSDLSNGIEHPLQNIARRVLSTHLFMGRQRVRNGLMKGLIYDHNGERLSDETLAKMGIERATTVVHEKVGEDIFRRLPPTERRMFVRNVPMKDQARVLKIMENGGPQTVEDVAIMKQVEPLFTIPVKKGVTRSTYHNWLKDKPQSVRDKTFAMWNNGEAEYYIIHDPELLMAIESVRPHELARTQGVAKNMLNFVGKITSWMGKMVTHMPQFQINMPLRDIPTALMKSQAGMTPLDFFQGWFHSIPALFPALAKEFPNTFKWWNERAISMASQTSLQAEFGGQLTSVAPRGGYRPARGGNVVKRAGKAIGFEVEKWVNEGVDKVFKGQSFTQASLAKKLWAPMRATFHTAYRFAGGVAGMSDATFRMTERILAKSGHRNLLERLRNDYYIHTRQYDKIDKVRYTDNYIDMLDRLLTLDFARKGEIVHEWSKLKMFAGPTFQDWNQHLNIMRDPARAAKFILMGTIAYTLPSMANYMRWKDDKDWQRLDYWDKFNFYHLFKRDDATFAKMPNGIGLLATVFKDFPMAVMQVMNDFDPMALAEWYNTSAIEQTPVQWLPVGQDARDFAVHVTPTVGEPFVQTAFNYSAFNNAPIDWDKDKINTQLPSERGKTKANVLEYALGRTGLFDWSTRQWSFMLRKQLPGFAGDLVYAPLSVGANKMAHALGIDPKIGEDYRAKESVFNFKTGSFYGPSSQPVVRLYEFHRKAQQALKTYEATNGADWVIKKYPEYEFAPVFKDAYGKVLKLKMDRGEFLNNYTGDPEEAKALALEYFDRQMTLIADEAILSYLEYKRLNPPAQIRPK